MKDLKGHEEKNFYNDQGGDRRHLLSQEVDIEYEDLQSVLREEAQTNEVHLEAEMSFINEDLEILSPKSRRSQSVINLIAVDKECQTDAYIPDAPSIRKVRNTSYEIKDCIATVSTKPTISVQKARVATQVVSSKFFGHEYHLQLPTTSTANPPRSKKPRSSEDYKLYEKVLRSEKSINNFKHKKALCQEVVAANALMNKKSSTKVTLHFDTTTRSRIDGDWPCLILYFSDDDAAECRMISLRPLFFAYEDREQIVCLIVETLQRLSVATNNSDVSAVHLWERIDALMTDAVSKNLKVGEGVAEKLGSNHVPYSLLCKAHTCERLDSDNLTTLSTIEAKFGLRELIGKREPLLKSFLRKKKCVVETALDALLKLVATDGDGKTTSLADCFNLKLEEYGVHKSLSLYKEKRFTRLGYQGGAVYDSIPYFKEVLEETPLNNLLVRGCKVYLENEFILAGFKALANFTYKVTMPFLNYMARTDQNSLVETLPKLCHDLKGKKTDTFAAYHVEWTHVKMKDNVPQSDLDHYILGEMCKQAAVRVELQCKREYWSDDSDNLRATAVNVLTSDQRKNLPSHNLSAERYLGKFGYLASQSAAHSNRQFTAKRIKDDLVLSDEQDVVVQKSLSVVMKNLDRMEISWSIGQKEKKKEKIKQNLQKKVRANEFVDQLLVKCKQHNGPVTSISELNALVRQKSPELKPFLRQEIQYQRVTHPRDADIRRELYKVNKLTIDEMVENLTVILCEDRGVDEAVVFPCEDEVMEILRGKTTPNGNTIVEETMSADGLPFKPNETLAVIWDRRKVRRWYIGFYIDTNGDETFRVDHLDRAGAGDKYWKRPTGYDDIQDTSEEQVVPVDVRGEWDFTAEKPRFIVFNDSEIQERFNEICQV